VKRLLVCMATLQLVLAVGSVCAKITREPIRGLHGNITSALESISGSGSEERYEKYRSRPRDLVLDEIELSYYKQNFDYGALRLWRPGERDWDGEIRLSVPHPYTQIRVESTNSRFYLYPGEGQSQRRETPALFRFGAPNGRWSVSAEFPAHRVRIGKTERAPVNYSSHDAVFKFSGVGSWGVADVVFGRLRYDDRAGEQPDHLTREVGLRYLRSTASLAGVSIDVTASRIRQSPMTGLAAPASGASGGRWVVQGFTSPLEPLMVSARVAGTYQNRRFTQTSYARRSSTASISAAYRGFRRMNIQAGYAKKRVSRLRRDQRALEHPVQNTFWTTIRYNPTPLWTGILKVETRQLDEEPSSGLQDPRPLLHNHINITDLRVLGTPTDNTEVHLFVSTDRRRNTGRNVAFTRTVANFGGWWQVAPRLGVSADAYSESYSTSGVELVPYYIRANTAQMGLVWSASKSTTVDLGFTAYRAGGTESLRQNVLALGARRRLDDGRRIGVELRRDRFRDLKTPSQSYSATVLWVSLDQQF